MVRSSPPTQLLGSADVGRTTGDPFSHLRNKKQGTCFLQKGAFLSRSGSQLYNLQITSTFQTYTWAAYCLENGTWAVLLTTGHCLMPSSHKNIKQRKELSISKVRETNQFVVLNLVPTSQVVMMHTFDPSTSEGETGRSL